MPARRRPQAEAAAWVAKLSRPSIGNDELRDFFAWRRDPANLAAYEAESRARRRRESRFLTQPDPFGHSVIDTWTGAPAAFAGQTQSGIPEDDAEEIAEILNRRALRGPRPAAH